MMAEERLLKINDLINGITLLTAFTRLLQFRSVPYKNLGLGMSFIWVCADTVIYAALVYSVCDFIKELFYIAY